MQASRAHGAYHQTPASHTQKVHLRRSKFNLHDSIERAFKANVHIHDGPAVPLKKPLQVFSKRTSIRPLTKSSSKPPQVGKHLVRHASTLARLPIGLQTLPHIFEEKFVYVDKTKEAYNILTKGSGRYFYSAPRRFGKSLFVSTLEEIANGKKESFKDLWIGKSNYKWDKFPTIKLDFSNLEKK